MLRIASIVAAAGLVWATLGCAGYYRAPVVPPGGAVYTSVQAPIDIDNDETRLGAKRGMASTRSIMGIVTWGDASTRAAAEQGGVDVIRHADYEFRNILGIYSRFTTIVYGD